MKQTFDLAEAERIAAHRFGEPASSARMASLQSLQDAYEDWRLMQQRWTVLDKFWSWTLDNA